MELRELQIYSSRLESWTWLYSIATPFPSINKVGNTSGTTQEDFYLDRVQPITLLDSGRGVDSVYIITLYLGFLDCGFSLIRMEP